MSLEHRATCTCGWSGDWSKHFIANGEADIHADACDGDVTVESEWAHEHAPTL